ncbi:MAG: fumarylacetoacetate hydrolase family protein [Candidatus Heimdallarchaeaceae archaeon]
MLIGRILFENRVFYAIYDKSEKMVYEIFSDILEFLNKPSEEIEISPSGVHIDDIEILPPIIPSKIVGIGRNYAGHARELGNEVPEFPVVFLKPISSLIPQNGIVKLPKLSKQVEYEGELALVIKQKLKKVKAEDIRNNPHEFFGYTAFLDITARDIQKIDEVWVKAKGFDTFGPIGPWININPLPESLRIKTFLNDEVRQDDDVNNMVFSPDILIEYISNYMTLEIGDVIITGTPEGVGQIEEGDRIRVEIDTLEPLEVTVENE